MGYKDPAKQRACWNRWYHRNKVKKHRWQAQRRAAVRAWMNEYKSKLKCGRCPENHPACLQFHHRDRKTKDLALGDALSQNWSTERLLKEIQKCVVLCANCHMKEHYDESNKNKV